MISQIKPVNENKYIIAGGGIGAAVGGGLSTAYILKKEILHDTFHNSKDKISNKKAALILTAVVAATTAIGSVLGKIHADQQKNFNNMLQNMQDKTAPKEAE